MIARSIFIFRIIGDCAAEAGSLVNPQSGVTFPFLVTWVGLIPRCLARMIQDTDTAEPALAASHSCPREVLDPSRVSAHPADGFEDFPLPSLLAPADTCPYLEFCETMSCFSSREAGQNEATPPFGFETPFSPRPQPHVYQGFDDQVGNPGRCGKTGRTDEDVNHTERRAKGRRRSRRWPPCCCLQNA